MPDPSEDSAVLNLDSGNTVSGIYQALQSYARTVPDAAVLKIGFDQEPDVEEGGVWQAGVVLQCYGGLERTETPEPNGESFLKNVEPKLVHEQRWSAKGQGFAGAVEELRDVVERQLQTLLRQRQQDLTEVGEALRVLRNPNELDNVWSLQDNPQDEPAEEENP